MKKSLIIVLLTALVLCAFTACDGDVNADLSGTGEKRVITLEVDSGDWAFDTSGTKTMELTIPSDCKTWGDLLGTKITLHLGTIVEVELTLTENYINEAWFHYGDYSANITAKTPGSVSCSAEISIGATYVLNVYVAS